MDQLQAAFEQLQTLIVEQGLNILGGIAILILALWVSGIVRRNVRKALKAANLEGSLVSFLTNLTYYAVLGLGITAALMAAGVPAATLVAALGTIGLAVGLALQGSLANFAAGVVILLTRPFSVGDLVEIGGSFGTVEEIQIIHTILRTLDNKIVTIPNDNITSDSIVNYSASGPVRVDMLFGIGYEDDILKAKTILQQILEENERVLESPAPIVAVAELADSSVNFAVRPYVNVDDFIPVQFEITEAVKLRFDEAGVSIPFPQRDVHLFQEA